MTRLALRPRPAAPITGAECAEIAARATAELGLPISIAVTERCAAIEELSPTERRQLAELTTRERARSWLRGRGALKALIGPFGDTDTARIQFPSPRYSLTHSGDVAVAVVARSERQRGIGVDVEWDRPAPVAAARFYLTEREAEWTAGLPDHERGTELLRLWTVKEALFKADPDNGPRVLSDYELADPGSWTGCATGARFVLRSISFRLRGGLLTLAVATEGVP